MAAGTGGRRRRLFPLIWLGSAISAVLLVLGVNGSLSAFSASITNSNNTTSTGTLLMKEAGPGSTGAPVTCNSTDGQAGNAATCTTINKYGAGGINTPLVPGGSNTTTVTISNPGTVNAGSFNVAFTGCKTTAPTGSPGTGDLCNYLTVSLYRGTTATGTPLIAAKTLNAAGTYTFATATDGAAMNVGGGGQAYTFVVNFPSSTTVGADNIYEGLSVTQSIVWTFNQ